MSNLSTTSSHGVARAPRRGTSPTISVVVASSRSISKLAEALDALVPQCLPLSAQLIVVRAGSEAEVLPIIAAMPRDVRFIYRPAGTRDGDLRAAGLAEAAGDIVAFTHDGAAVASDWLATLVRRARPAQSPQT